MHCILCGHTTKTTTTMAIATNELTQVTDLHEKRLQLKATTTTTTLTTT